MPLPHHNHSLSQLTDAYGAIVAEIRGLELRRDALKAALIERAGDTAEVFGERFKVSISHATRWTLDTSAVRAKLGERWCQQHSKLSTVTSLRALSCASPALVAA